MASLSSFLTKVTLTSGTRANLVVDKSKQQKWSLISFQTRLKNGNIRKNTVRRQPVTVTCLFTGIVEELGRVEELGPSQTGGFDMRIGAELILEGVKLGDNIVVNGTCLTVTTFSSANFTVGLIAPETLHKTSLIELSAGSPVNLECAVLPTSRMGGHFVQGHVDGTGEIVAKEREGDSLWIKVRTGCDLLRYIVPKGFIVVDGISLTVVNVFDDEECFNFMLVAYTQQNVVIPLKEVGLKVNLEVDIHGKYVERILNISGDSSH